MSEGRVNLYRDAVVARIAQAMPGLRSCEAQFGRFDLGELDTSSLPAPAVRFAVLDARLPQTATDQKDAQLRCGAFIITDGRERDRTGWAMAEAIAVIVGNAQRWGLAKVGMPADVRIVPILSAATRQRGVAVMAVEWTQPLYALGEAIFDAAGVVVEAVYVNGEAVEPEELEEPEESGEAGDA